ncbi:alpha/beta hydrolase [Actinomyces sp. oral taxon 171]|uniref:alpha/beta hydrolase n=1 Tax=Actinomyces sp. oral taxon 171 TaxID=706438 RepID=UPI0001F62577|nr:alpha/beta hydrolase [Actinomyces sp. oral taxon 171]EFW27563.1 TAP-like protein [Actinomyces sp. oral taxon 171 str. F0337]
METKVKKAKHDPRDQLLSPAVDKGRRSGGMRRRRVSAGVLAVVTGACLGVGAGVVPAAAAPASGPAPAATKAAVPQGLESFYGQKVEWYDCVATAGVEKSADKTGFQCAKVTVPLDYSHPDGQTIEIAMKKHLATGSTRQGTLFMNPGGPGESGVNDIGESVTSTFAGVQKAYDIIGFDPRGVGSSTAVNCTSDTELEAASEGTPVNAGEGGMTFEQRAAVISAQFKQFEASCAANTKPTELLDHVDTVSVARDLDVLRALSGDQKLNYAGFSYGTYLGAHYAELFPANTGRMFLDGAQDPSLSFTELIKGQARGFERALRNYVAWCQSGQSCPLSGDVDAGVQQIGDIFTSADQSPVPSSDATRPVTGDDMKQVVSVMLYSPETAWDTLNEAFGEVVNENNAWAFRSIADQLDAQPLANTGALISVNCLDYRVEGDMATWKAQSEELQKISPRFASTFDGVELGCQAWGHTGTQPSKALHAKGSAPILVIGTTGDPATPYEDAVALADQLDSGQLLTWEGNGHTAYASSGSGPCVTKAVDTYLLTGTMPKKGLTCHGTE